LTGALETLELDTNKKKENKWWKDACPWTLIEGKEWNKEYIPYCLLQ
jgi:hypothetical protein